MYKTILVTLDGTGTDRAIIEHVKVLAKLAASRVILAHFRQAQGDLLLAIQAILHRISPSATRIRRIARNRCNFTLSTETFSASAVSLVDQPSI